MKTFHKRILATVSALAFGFPAIAAAQTVGGLEEITVTARKRNETLIETPVAVSTLSAEDLARRGISDYLGLEAFTPGFRIMSQGSSVSTRGFHTFVLRGIYPGSDSPDRQAVSMFLDGTPIGGGAAIPGMTDIERVEVVNGPQSAYFGRATFAGAVNFITKEPGDTFTGRVDGDLSTYNGYEIKGQVEGPLVPGILKARVSGRAYHAGGQYSNYGFTGKLGAKSTQSGSVALSFTPSDSFKMRSFFTYWHDGDGPAMQGYLLTQDENCNAGVGVGGVPAINYFCGPISVVPGNRITQTPAPQSTYDSLANANATLGRDFITKPGLERRAYLGTTTADYTFSNGMSFTLNGSVGRNKWAHIVDLANRYTVPNTYLWFIVPYDIKNASTEARLTSDQTGRLKYLAGASYYMQKATQGISSNRNGLFSPGPARNTTFTDTYGFFGSVSYDITDALSASVEGRYQIDKLSQKILTTGLVASSGKTGSFVPRAILQYKFDTNLSAYASYSEGTRSVQFNGTVFTLPAAAQAQIQAQASVPLKVPEEHLSMYEVGLKGDFLDRRLRILSAFYYGDWTDKQIQVTLFYNNPGLLTLPVILPNGHVELYGTELQVTFQATEALTVEGTLGYAESKIKRTNCTDCVAITGNLNPVGNRLPRYPAMTGSASATYRQHVFTDFDGYLRVDYMYTGRQFETEANVAWVPSASNVNLRVGIESDRYSLEAYATNVFNNRVPGSLTRGVDSFNARNVMEVTPPQRTVVGARAGVKF